MTRNDWYEAGDQIKRLVQNAVDTGNFSELGNTISNVVNDTVYGFQNSVRGNFTGQQNENDSRQEQNRNGGAGRQTLQLSSKVPGELSSKAMKYLGFGGGILLGVVYLCLALIAAWVGFYFMWDIANTFGLMCVLCLVIGVWGQKRLEMNRRLQRYAEVMGTRSYCPIQELADGVEANLNPVRRDLRKIIRRGYLTEGYMDRQETLLIADRETYQQYLSAESSYEERKKEAQRAEEQAQAKQQQEDAAAAERSPEHQKLIEEGQNYIRHIRECNDRIPGEEMTEKLNRLELVVSRIFQEAEKNPDSVSDLRKMMSYYLPTTQKLLDAYCELDNQQIHGENIDTTKQEIENSLDTINDAFEKLFDSLYMEQAWDISSDISVLNTMLAQEGLTKNDFPNRNTGNTKNTNNTGGKNDG